MKFEFDAQKSKVNKTKHGVDFVEAQTLWKDFDRLEIRARTEDEPRSLVVVKIGTNIGLPLSLIHGSKTRTSKKTHQLECPRMNGAVLGQTSDVRRISRQALIKIWLSEKIKQAEI